MNFQLNLFYHQSTITIYIHTAASFWWCFKLHLFYHHSTVTFFRPYSSKFLKRSVDSSNCWAAVMTVRSVATRTAGLEPRESSSRSGVELWLWLCATRNPLTAYSWVVGSCPASSRSAMSVPMMVWKQKHKRVSKDNTHKHVSVSYSLFFYFNCEKMTGT